MDDYDGTAAGYGRFAARQAPPPPPGDNQDFDAYVLNMFGDELAEDGDEDELRRAAWATWQIAAPTTVSGNGRSRDENDDDLQKALALSREDFAANGDGRGARDDPIELADDDDEDLKKAIAMSEEEARAPKRQRRASTPDEERKQLEAALAASLEGATQETDEAGLSSNNLLDRSFSDDAIEKANQEFQRKREADREQQRRERELKNGSRSGTTMPKAPGSPRSRAAPTSTEKGKQKEQESGAAPTARMIPASTASGSSNPSGNTALKAGGLAFDRAQMEQERLARQRAREEKMGNGSGSGNHGASSSSVANGAGTSTNAAASSSALPFTAPVPTQPQLHPLQSQGPFPRDAAGEYYLDGELRHSALTIGKPSSAPTFTLSQVMGKQSEISFFILNSFVLDDEWLNQHLPPPDECPQIIIRPHPKDMPHYNGKVQAQPSGEIFCYPRMIGEWGSAHMKYLWIWYKTGRLRVVVSTANFVPYDWDWIENTIFVQDFFLLPTPRQLDPTILIHDLPSQFRFLFIHLKVHKGLKYLIDHHPQGKQIPFSPTNGFADMDNYDWSRLKVRVVMSVPGTYDGYQEMQGFGMCRLGKVLRDEGWVPQRDETVSAEYQCSSLGQYGFEWWQYFYNLCSGKTIQNIQIMPKAKEYGKIKVLYPTLATVDASDLGRDGGGTMFVGKSWTPGTKKLFHDANSKRGGVLMHAKLLVAQFEAKERMLGFSQPSQGDASPENGKKRKADEISRSADTGGWVYVGSHNFSSAAWGTMNIKKQSPSLNIRNYELGIVFPLPRGKTTSAIDAIVPYKRPARPYSATDVPWASSYTVAFIHFLLSILDWVCNTI